MTNRFRAAAFVALIAFIAVPAWAGVPSQFLAKLYTEALGRAPDAGGWEHWTQQFGDCNPGDVATKGRITSFVKTFTANSSEFQQRGFTPGEKAIVAYRIMLNRDPEAHSDPGRPDLSALRWAASTISAHGLEYLIDLFAASQEFENVWRSMCDPAYGWREPQSVYRYSELPDDERTSSGCGLGDDVFPGTEGWELHDYLLQKYASGGGTVYLKQRQIITIPRVLHLPPGVNLFTCGLPQPTHYPRMARLVRAEWWDDYPENPNGGALVRVARGASLGYVWLSGRRHAPNVAVTPVNINVELSQENWGSIEWAMTAYHLRSDSTAGWTHIGSPAEPALATEPPCRSGYVAHNLITGYSNRKYLGLAGQDWSDGISVSCTDLAVHGNTIIDASDYAIVLFAGDPYQSAGNPGTSCPGTWPEWICPSQNSEARWNTVLNAGNSAFGMFGMQEVIGGQRYGLSFTGGFRENYVLGSHNAGADFIFTAGTRMLDFIPRKEALDQKAGVGGYFIDNRTLTSASRPVLTEVPMMVDGMTGVTVSGNAFAKQRLGTWDGYASLEAMGGRAACTGVANASRGTHVTVGTTTTNRPAWSSAVGDQDVGDGTFAPADASYLSPGYNDIARGCLAP